MCNLTDDYYTLLLKKTAKECSNGHFFENANWRQTVLNIFENHYSVQQSQDEAIQQLVSSNRESNSRAKDDLDTTGDLTNECLIYVPETQVVSSQRCAATQADNTQISNIAGQKPSERLNDVLDPMKLAGRPLPMSNNSAKLADNKCDLEQMSINPGQQTNPPESPSSINPVTLPPKPLSAATENLDAIHELNDSDDIFDIATPPNKPTYATASVTAATSVSSDEKVKDAPPKSLSNIFESSDNEVDTNVMKNRPTRVKMLTKKTLNGHINSATKSSIVAVPKISSATLRNNTVKSNPVSGESKINRFASIKSVDDNHRNVRSKHKTAIMFTKVEVDQYMPLIAKLAFKVVDLPKDANVLVSNSVYRTYKFLSAVALGMPIISEKWLSEMEKQQCYVAYDKFHLLDKVSEDRYKFVLEKSLAAARDKPLFAKYSILVTANTRPPPNELEIIILCADGKYLNQLLDRPRLGDTVLVVSTEQDKRGWVAIRKKFPNITIINTEGFMMSIMQQCLNFSDYTLT